MTDHDPLLDPDTAAEDDTHTPPHDPAAERMVLAACISDPESFALVADKLELGDFYLEPNRWIYEAVLKLTASGAAVDIVSVAGKLRDDGRLKQIGDTEYLVNLCYDVPAVGGIEEKARRIVDFARARKLIATAHKIAAVGYSVRGDEVQSYLEQSEGDVFAIVQGSETRDVASMHDVQQSVYQNLLRAELRGAGNVDMPTGIAQLDKKIGGLGPSRLTVVAARPSMGKTSLVTGFAETLGALGKLVLLFSLEMPREQVGARMACCRSGASVHRALNGWMLDRERADFIHAQDDLGALPIFIDDTPGISLVQIRARARRIQAKRKEPIAMIAVDYLQLMTAEVSKGSTREREIASITAGLKRLARELECSIVLLSQLNRECETRDDKRPRLSDLRESGAIEQDADDIVFIYRDEWYHEATEDKGIAELIVGKQRNGPTGVVRCGFDGKSTAFYNLYRSPQDETEAA
jgi:replicative DNA helicase